MVVNIYLLNISFRSIFHEPEYNQVLCSNVLPVDGNYSGGRSANVTLPPGSSAGDQVCANTLIHSDGVLEVSEATFNIQLFPRQSGRVSVPVERRFARVTIVDANGKQLIQLCSYKDLEGYLGRYISLVTSKMIGVSLRDIWTCICKHNNLWVL